MIDKRLLKEMPTAKKYVLKTVAMQWLSLLCNIGFVILIAGILDKAFQEELSIDELWMMCAIAILLIVLRMIVTKRSARYIHAASCDVKDHLRTKLYNKLLELKNSYVEYISTSELVQLNVEGIDQMETYFGRYLPQFFYSMLAPITLFIVLVWMDVKSSIVLLLCVPLIPLSIIAVQKFAKKLLSKYWTSYASLGDSFLENLQGLTVLKIYQADKYKNEKMNEEAETFRKITMKVLTMQLNSVSVMDLIAYGGAAIGSIIAIYGYIQGSVSLFAVICIILLSSEFFIPLRLLGSYFHIAMNGIAASDKIFRILDLQVEQSGTIHLEKKDVDVQMQHVSFSYDGEREILNDISLEIKPHQFIGIVGESGSGKSTIAKLLCGFAHHYTGNILLQGKERNDIDDLSFYEHVAYVTHKPMIIKGSIRDNLRLGKSDASDQECYEVLAKTCLKDFIEEQGGLDFMLAENGNNLSGGQKQRLSLARALLANREIYLFDEATSNIDVESEELILNVIKELMKEKTVIMITHRLHNIIDSDQIYVIENGECKEHGTHQELMENKTHYATMYQKQLELETLKGGLEDAER